MRLTLKAQRELAALAAGLDIQDACDVLATLAADDFAGRLQSEHTGEWMYVFKRAVADRRLPEGGPQGGVLGGLVP